MATTEIVSWPPGHRHGKFSQGRLRSLVNEMPDKFTVLAALGTCCTGKSSILNDLFRSGFATGERWAGQTTLGIQGSAIRGEDIVLLAKDPRGLVVLDVEGADSRDQSRTQPQQMLASFGFAISDVVMVVLNMRDIGRLESSGISSLFVTVEENLQLRSEKVMGSTEKRRQLLVTVIPDFDKQEYSREDTIAAIMRDYKTALTATARPTGYVSTRLNDLFEFEFVTLSNKTLFPEEFAAEVKEFQSRLLEPTVEEYLFEKDEYANPNSATDFCHQANKLWGTLNHRLSTDAAPYDEVNATFRCDLHMKEAYRQYQLVGRRWKASVMAGSIIKHFGDEAEKIVNETVQAYENMAQDLKNTSAYQRKREELRENILSELGLLYNLQIMKIKKLAFEQFKSNLERTSVYTMRVEKIVEQAMKKSEKDFLVQADHMKCRGSRWRCETERSDLLKTMREVATERLQIARLQGNYVPGLRAPVNVTFHYLNPSVRPEDFLPSSLGGDRPERMITVPQRVRRDTSNKADPGRFYAHQETSFGGDSTGLNNFNLPALF